MKNIIALTVGISTGLGYGGNGSAEAVNKVRMVVEHINVLPDAMRLMECYDIEMPIISAVNAVINGNADPSQTVKELMSYDKKKELTKSVASSFRLPHSRTRTNGGLTTVLQKYA